MTTQVTVLESEVTYDAFTIADGEDTSAVIDLEGRSLVGVRFEADTTNTAFTFETSRTEDGTFVDLRDSTPAAITLTVDATATGEYVLSPTNTITARYIKVKGAVNESGADAVGYLISRVV